MAWAYALEAAQGPVALALTRQALPPLRAPGRRRSEGRSGAAAISLRDGDRQAGRRARRDRLGGVARVRSGGEARRAECRGARRVDAVARTLRRAARRVSPRAAARPTERRSSPSRWRAARASGAISARAASSTASSASARRRRNRSSPDASASPPDALAARVLGRHIPDAGLLQRMIAARVRGRDRAEHGSGDAEVLGERRTGRSSM